MMDSESQKIIDCYNLLPAKIDRVRERLKRPLTLSEKILYTHLSDTTEARSYLRGTDYALFSPDRIAMQDATAQMALLQFMVTGRNTTLIPSSVHCDHLIVASEGAEKDLRDALEVNREVYEFLKSASLKYGIDFWKPGSGIIHQIVFENYAWPGGMMIGTDSHTPTAGGLGMLAIGVGGADAVDVMAGMGWELKFPRILGIKLTGKLNGWTSAKDIILKITGMLSVKGGTGSIIEYFGDGSASISATGKATICNMGAETGATCSVFGFDRTMSDYLRASGRKEIADNAGKICEYLNADPEVIENPERFYDTYLEINLSELEPYINGPFSPDIATPISGMKDVVARNNWPEIISAGLIGSCTNSSYEDLARAASVIKNGLDNHVLPASELLITPGSEQIKSIAEKEGYLEIFRKAGAAIYANACGPCIGQWKRKGSKGMPVNSVVHSYNRNFAKRTDGNPNTHAFVASPEIVAALTLAGKLTFNPLTDSLINSCGNQVNLAEPRGTDIPVTGFDRLQSGPEKNVKRKAMEVIVKPGSERLQLLKPFKKWDGKDMNNLFLLMKVSGKCTTDHISMAGKWLRYRGHLENISKNYMLGALNSFNNKTGIVLNQHTGKYDSVPAVAEYYKNMSEGSVVVGEENFGEGSSREHAALEPRYLNVKAIIVKSFARIHETNLKKQGVLALTFADKDDFKRFREDDKIDINGLQDFSPGKQLEVIIRHSDRTSEKFPVNHSFNKLQIEWYREGSALNLIRKKIGS